MSLLLGLTASDAWATCVNWAPNLAASLTTGHESEAIHFTWSAAPSSCSAPPFSFSFDHYEICWKQDVDSGSPPAPGGPTGPGVMCENVSNVYSTTSKDVYVNRSDRMYSATIFACQSTGLCTAYYGDGSTGYTVSASKSVTNILTEYEHWRLMDVSDYDNTDASPGWVISSEVDASAAMFYPTEFTDHDYLALWTTQPGAHGLEEDYQIATTPGWQDFGSTSWDNSAGTVAQESNGGDWIGVSNPWVVPAVDNSNEEDPRYYVRMYLQVGDGNTSQSLLGIRSVDSYDQDGTDFLLNCGSSPCTVASGGTCANGDKCDYDGGSVVSEVEICTYSISFCHWLDHSAHGTIGWDSVDSGPVDFSADAPFILFTGQGDQTNGPMTPNCSDGPDDVYEAEWAGGSPLWTIGTHMESGHTCPNRQFDNDHDPYILPLPGGGFKAYYNRANPSKTPFVCYNPNGAPGSWEACVEIVMAFSTATTWDTTPTDGVPADPDPHDCVGDTDMFAYKSSGTRYEGGFTVTQTEDDDPKCFQTKNRLVFIEHQN